MSLATLKSSIIAAVSSNSSIKTWSNGAYGNDHEVFDGIDSRDTPGEDHCPYVALVGYGENVSERKRVREYWFAWVGFVFDDSLKTTSYTNLTQYTGGVEVETFRKLVESAILGVVNGGVMDVDVDIDVNDNFPFFRFEMITTIAMTTTFGGDPLS